MSRWSLSDEFAKMSQTITLFTFTAFDLLLYGYGQLLFACFTGLFHKHSPHVFSKSLFHKPLPQASSTSLFYNRILSTIEWWPLHFHLNSHLILSRINLFISLCPQRIRFKRSQSSLSGAIKHSVDHLTGHLADRFFRFFWTHQKPNCFGHFVSQRVLKTSTADQTVRLWQAPFPIERTRAPSFFELLRSRNFQSDRWSNRMV